jgi:Cu+-exporting ATPase
VNRLSENELLRLAASAERSSEHPLGEAIVTSAQERGLTLSSVQAFNAIAGHGIEAEVDNHKLLLGNAKLLRGGPDTGRDDSAASGR